MNCRLLIFFGLLLIFSCTDDIVIPELEELDNTSTITGYLVGGVNNMATAYLIESDVIDSTYISSETGYFAFYNVERGDYILKVTSANGKGSYKQYLSINSNLKTLGDIYLKPFPGQIESVYPDPIIVIDTNNYYYEDSIQEVSIYFNYALNESSLINSIHLSPDLPFTYDYISSTNYEVLQIKVQTDSLFDFPYLSITLDSTIETVYSEQLDYTYTVTYSVDTTISLIDPIDTTLQDTTIDTTVIDTNNIKDTIAPVIQKTFPLDTNALLDFSDDDFYIYFGSLVNQANVDNAIKIFPPVSFNTSWRTTTDSLYGSISYVRLSSYDKIMTNTIYTVTIDSGTVLNNDIVLDSTISRKFKTKPLRVISTYPQYGQIDIPVNDTLRIRFSDNFSKPSIEGRIKISPSVKGLNISTLNNSSFYGYNIYLMADSLFNPKTEYYVTVSDSITDIFGNKMLDSVVVKFTTSD